ncbi:MAG: HEAT repeat domain-containing protein [Polyangiaceae bacterium]
MISPQRALVPVVRVFSRARQTVALFASRLPSPVQQRAASALQTLAARWPRLAGLLGIPSASSSASAVGSMVAPTDDIGTVPPSTRTSSAAHLADLRGAADYRDRVRAARALASIVDEETTGALALALKDASVEVAVEAAEALGSHRVESAVAALRAAVDNRDGYYSPLTRAASVRALGTLLPADQAMTIAAAVADVDSTVSLAAIAALADRDEFASTHALKAVLEDRAGFYLPATRQAAARGLLRLQRLDKDTCRALLENEFDATVREVLVALQASETDAPS